MMRALVVGGGIGGLATAVALQRIGIKASVFEKAPQIGEVGAGLSLWSNAMIALRWLGLEAAAQEAGSVIGRMRTFLPTGKPLGSVDFPELGRRAGAVSICVHRATLQRLLLNAALATDPESVHTGRECTAFEAHGSKITALFFDGSRESGDVLIGADGVHSVIRDQLFGREKLRFPGYLAWRGMACGPEELYNHEPMVVVARGSQAGYFRCGEGGVYWFLTKNAPPGSRAGAGGNKSEVINHIKNWRIPLRRIVEATDDDGILRNDVVDRPERLVWGMGLVTLLGDAAHAMTPDLGQGACQALEDAVVLADSMRRVSSAEAGLRHYETLRRDRANFVVRQSSRIGRVAQLANPVAVWLRQVLGSTDWAQKQTERLFERLLRIDLPELTS